MWLQCGEEFPIFVDRKDLKWGQQWKARIEQSLDCVTFQFNVTRLLKSESCREEFFRFLKPKKT